MQLNCKIVLALALEGEGEPICRPKRPASPRKALLVGRGSI